MYAIRSYYVVGVGEIVLAAVAFPGAGPRGVRPAPSLRPLSPRSRSLPGARLGLLAAALTFHEELSSLPSR